MNPDLDLGLPLFCAHLVGDFIAQTFAFMARLLGPLHEESYIHVIEARGHAYGYGGLTQERRYIAGRQAPRRAA